MCLYKLVKYLKNYVNLEQKKSLVEIKSQSIRKWLHKLGYESKDVKKNVFVDEYKWLNVVKDFIRFLNKLEKLKPYLVNFNENSIIKDKIYSSDCAIDGKNLWPVIVITYNEYTISAHEGIYNGWTRVGDTFLHTKSQKQDIMISKFLLPFGCLNLFLLSEKNKRL